MTIDRTSTRFFFLVVALCNILFITLMYGEWQSSYIHDIAFLALGCVVTFSFSLIGHRTKNKFLVYTPILLFFCIFSLFLLPDILNATVSSPLLLLSIKSIFFYITLIVALAFAVAIVKTNTVFGEVSYLTGLSIAITILLLSYVSQQQALPPTLNYVLLIFVIVHTFGLSYMIFKSHTIIEI